MVLRSVGAEEARVRMGHGRLVARSPSLTYHRSLSLSLSLSLYLYNSIVMMMVMVYMVYGCVGGGDDGCEL